MSVDDWDDSPTVRTLTVCACSSLIRADQFCPRTPMTQRILTSTSFVIVTCETINLYITKNHKIDRARHAYSKHPRLSNNSNNNNNDDNATIPYPIIEYGEYHFQQLLSCTFFGHAFAGD